MKKKERIIFFSIIIVFVLIVLGCQILNSGGNSTDKNLIKNGDFNKGISDWNLWMNSGCEASMVVENSELKITITNQGVNPWDMGLQQAGFTIKKLQAYTLSFMARTDSVKSIRSLIQLGQYPWNNYSGSHTFNLTTTMT